MLDLYFRKDIEVLDTELDENGRRNPQTVGELIEGRISFTKRRIRSSKSEETIISTATLYTGYPNLTYDMKIRYKGVIYSIELIDPAEDFEEENWLKVYLV